MKRILPALLFNLLALTSAQQVLAQAKTVTGKVVSDKGEPVPSASVHVKGASAGVVTDSTGTFHISVPSPDAVLIISSTGYSREEVPVGKDADLSVRLVQEPRALNEVVVVGYGSARKKDLTGAVTTVSAKDFQKGVISTPEQLIAGKVAGVQITSNGGAPGGGSSIKIRGGSSLSATNDPLIVVDGVPLSTGTIPGAANPLSLINPNDIESFNVLKDAAATAIYGARASNGVIIIITKKGVSGKPKFNFSSQVSASKPAGKVEVLSATEYRDLVNAKGSAGQKALLGTANTDWQDAIYQTAISHDHNLSVRGSLAKMPYRVSVGYLDQDGILKTGNMKRTSAALNLSPKFLDNHLSVEVSLKGAQTKNRFANEDAIGAAVIFDPTQPVRSGNKRYGGYFEWLDPGTGRPNSLATRNPLGLIEQKDDQSTVYRSIGNAQIDYKFHFLPELRANLNVGYDASQGKGGVFINDSAAAQYGQQGQRTQYKESRTTQLLEGYLNYTKNFGSSRLEAMTGYSYQDFLTKTYNFAERNAYGDTIPGKIPNFPFDKPRYTTIGFYGRVNYSFKDRYLLTAIVRRDGVSRFGPEHRWGTFPAFALAWNINEESFLKGSTAINQLKLRLGYGITGQAEGIANYDYISYYAFSSQTARYQLGDQFYNMYRPGGYYAKRKWEETVTYNAGLDYGFAKNRVSGSLDIYLRKTGDLLNEIPQSAGSNFSNRIVANVGSMENRGVEFSLNTTPIRNSRLTWDVNFNVTYNKSKITKLTLAPDTSYRGNPTGDISGGTGNTIQIHSVNNPRSSFYVYQQVYDSTGKPIENLFVDRNADGVINERDRYHYKYPDPRLLLGLSSNLTYGKWNAGFVMRANFFNYVYNNVYSDLGKFNPNGSTLALYNASVNYYETGFEGTSVNQYLSDYYVQNASFLRMDNLFVGYNLGRIYRNVNLRLNGTVQNVFVITKYKGLDPEIGNGIDRKFYPRPRTYVLGVNLDF
ncbi:TonB-dependent receptor [Paraflavisolibacter sp. H34]|uniref:SusC/RagA family TonB-linked outer membrane protein n=1 Tax=Huijunlia imazamoxiresistens TaxID=3127457 RepID=UPI003018AB89